MLCNEPKTSGSSSFVSSSCGELLRERLLATSWLFLGWSLWSWEVTSIVSTLLVCCQGRRRRAAASPIVALLFVNMMTLNILLSGFWGLSFALPLGCPRS